MIYIWVFTFIFLNYLIGNYIYYLPLLYSIIFYIKSNKIKSIDNKILFLNNNNNNNNNNIKNKIKLKFYNNIKFILNNINITTDIFNSKYIENKIIYFKKKYPNNYTINQYDVKDKLLIYSLKFDNKFVKIINEILLFILFYLKLLTKYVISQQFGSFYSTKYVKPNNISNNLSIYERKKNILAKIKNN